MASAPGHSGEGQSDEASPRHAHSWVWQDDSGGTTTGEYGELSWDNTVEIEPTVEDRGPVVPLKVERSFSHSLSQVQGIEESGDFDLTPLRHLLEQDWADPGAERSRADYRPQSAKSGAWYAAGSPAEAETMEVKTIDQSSAPTVAALPSEADFPDLVMEQRPSGPPARPIAPPPPKPRKAYQRLLLVGGAVAVLAVLAIPVLKMGDEGQTSTTSKPPAQTVASSVELAESSEQPEQPTPVQPEVAAAPPVEPVSAPPAISSSELDWSGVPEGSKIFWQGAKTSLSELGSAPAGKYDVKVFAPSRPVVRLSLNISPAQSGPVLVGQQVKEALAQQPVLTVSLAKSPGKAVQVKVRELGQGATFKAATKLQGATGSGVVLPKAGKYKVEVGETATHQAYGQTVTVDSGAKKSVKIALKAAPPRVVSAPAASSSYSSGSGYSEPAYYPPPPPRSYGGGGGGGGRIAPPSF